MKISNGRELTWKYNTHTADLFNHGFIFPIINVASDTSKMFNESWVNLEIFADVRPNAFSIFARLSVFTRNSECIVKTIRRIWRSPPQTFHVSAVHKSVTIIPRYFYSSNYNLIREDLYSENRNAADGNVDNVRFAPTSDYFNTDKSISTYQRRCDCWLKGTTA